MKPTRIVWGVAPLILSLIARAASTITESSSGVNSIGVRVAFD